jgi:hypothetical protein
MTNGPDSVQPGQTAEDPKMPMVDLPRHLVGHFVIMPPMMVADWRRECVD